MLPVGILVITMVMAAIVDLVGKACLSINWTDAAKFITSAMLDFKSLKCAHGGSQCIICLIQQLSMTSANQLLTIGCGANVAIVYVGVMSSPPNVSKGVLTNANIRTTREGNARKGKEVGTFLRRNKKNSERRKEP